MVNDVNISTKSSPPKGQGTGSFFTDTKYSSADIIRDSSFVYPEMQKSCPPDIPVKPPRLRKINPQ